MEKQQKQAFAPTLGQKKAIENSGHDILVSASAGSGKTKVLIERIIGKITKENISVENLLVVTFTDAKEMKDRLITALQQELQTAFDPKLKKHLQQQLMQVNTADISTLHAFCMRLIREYYYLLDLDPNFRLLADDTERVLLRYDVWEELFETYYQQLEDVLECRQTETAAIQVAKNFEKIVQIFGKDRNDTGVCELVMRLDEFASANANPDRWLDNLAQLYAFESGQSFMQTTLWQEHLQKIILTKLLEAKEKLTQRNLLFETKLKPAMDQLWLTQVDVLLKDFEKKQKRNLGKYQEKLTIQQQELADLTAIIAMCQANQDWDQLRQKLLQFKISGQPILKKYSSPTAPNDIPLEAVDLNNQMKELQEQVKKTLADLTQTYFELTEQQLFTVLEHSSQVIERLAQMVKDFRQAYQQEKKRRHLLDFNDLEHFALAIVAGDTPESQRIQTLLREKYSEIMVDEYQDTNGVQEALLTKIARKHPGNMFMVGDIKQSIYRFRQANPQLFNSKLQKYTNLSGEQTLTANASGEKILLQENFRSVANIADFTNLIFKQLMDQKLGEITYDQDAYLKAANPSYPTSLAKIPIEILIYESNLADQDEQPELEATFAIDSKQQGQILVTAQKIKQLVETKQSIFDKKTGQMRPISFGDIAILAATHGDSLLITEEFKKQGIPVNVDNANNYFKTTEIQIMMSLLQIIDNPQQDIALVAVLRSPMYGFDENELAYLRIQAKQGNFYEALTSFKADMTNTFEKQIAAKQQRFLADLAMFRDTAHKDELAVLIWQIYQQTGFLDYVGGMPGGKKRQANLHALYNRATEYEKMSFKGIFQFVRFIKKMQERDNDLAQINVVNGNDAVTFMTIHKSKGLEFPVVFLINTRKQVNLRDILHENYLLDEQLGLGLTYLDELEVAQTKVKAKIKTPILELLKEETLNKTLAEEMRKLYVALTRAEQRLYLVGEYQDLATCLQKWSKALSAQDLVLPVGIRKSLRACYLDWIGSCLIRTTTFAQNFVYCEANQKTPLANLTEFKEIVDATRPALALNAPFKIEFWSQSYLQNQLRQPEMQTLSAKEWLKRQANFGAFDGTAFEEMLTYQYEKQNLTKISAYQAVSDIKRFVDDPDNQQMQPFDVTEDTDILTLNSKLQAVSEFSLPQFMQTTTNVSPAQIGTATHLIFQKLPLSTPPTSATLTVLIEQLVLEGLLTSEVAKKVDIKGILGLYQTKLGQEILKYQATLKREEPLAMLYPLTKLFQQKISDQQKAVLVHGIVDGYFINDQDEIVLFDYKTDNYTLQRKQEIIERYRGQLNLYAQALENITHKKVVQKYLYMVKTQEILAI